MSQTDPRLTRAIVRLILVAAIVTAPIFLFGEGFEAKYIGRVAASNGTCIVLMLGLQRMLAAGHARAASMILVYGLLALVGSLAWFNGERVHVNVVNFVLVAVLASAVANRAVLLSVVALSAVEMVAIAWDRPFPFAGHSLAEARFEAIAQFLPTYLVIAVILWLRASRSH